MATFPESDNSLIVARFWAMFPSGTRWTLRTVLSDIIPGLLSVTFPFLSKTTPSLKIGDPGIVAM